jgi:hypothetical protein
MADSSDRSTPSASMRSTSASSLSWPVLTIEQLRGFHLRPPRVDGFQSRSEF